VKACPVNRWDILLLPLVFGVLFLLAWGAHQMVEPYRFGAPPPISLDPALLAQWERSCNLTTYKQ
jgi:hypothetical protein